MTLAVTLALALRPRSRLRLRPSIRLWLRLMWRLRLRLRQRRGQRQPYPFLEALEEKLSRALTSEAAAIDREATVQDKWAQESKELTWTLAKVSQGQDRWEQEAKQLQQALQEYEHSDMSAMSGMRAKLTRLETENGELKALGEGSPPQARGHVSTWPIRALHPCTHVMCPRGPSVHSCAW